MECHRAIYFAQFRNHKTLELSFDCLYPEFQYQNERWDYISELNPWDVRVLADELLRIDLHGFFLACADLDREFRRQFMPERSEAIQRRFLGEPVDDFTPEELDMAEDWESWYYEEEWGDEWDFDPSGHHIYMPERSSERLEAEAMFMDRIEEMLISFSEGDISEKTIALMKEACCFCLADDDWLARIEDVDFDSKLFESWAIECERQIELFRVVCSSRRLSDTAAMADIFDEALGRECLFGDGSSEGPNTFISSWSAPALSSKSKDGSTLQSDSHEALSHRLAGGVWSDVSGSDGWRRFRLTSNLRYIRALYGVILDKCAECIAVGEVSDVVLTQCEKLSNASISDLYWIDMPTSSDVLEAVSRIDGYGCSLLEGIEIGSDSLRELFDLLDLSKTCIQCLKKEIEEGPESSFLWNWDLMDFWVQMEFLEREWVDGFTAYEVSSFPGFFRCLLISVLQSGIRPSFCANCGHLFLRKYPNQQYCLRVMHQTGVRCSDSRRRPKKANTEKVNNRKWSIKRKANRAFAVGSSYAGRYYSDLEKFVHDLVANAYLESEFVSEALFDEWLEKVGGLERGTVEKISSDKLPYSIIWGGRIADGCDWCEVSLALSKYPELVPVICNLEEPTPFTLSDVYVAKPSSALVRSSWLLRSVLVYNQRGLSYSPLPIPGLVDSPLYRLNDRMFGGNSDSLRKKPESLEGCRNSRGTDTPTVSLR